MSASHEHAVRILHAAYGAAEPTDAQMSAYLLALVDLDPDAVWEAVVRIIRLITHGPPPPADVRVEAVALDDDTPDAAEAWDEVRAMIGTVGHVGRPVFSHELTARAVASLGGWLRLCASETPDMDRDSFLVVFDRLAERARRERLLGLRPIADPTEDR